MLYKDLECPASKDYMFIETLQSPNLEEFDSECAENQQFLFDFEQNFDKQLLNGSINVNLEHINAILNANPQNIQKTNIFEIRFNEIIQLFYNTTDVQTTKLCASLIQNIISSSPSLFDFYLTKNHLSNLISSLSQKEYLLYIDEIYDILEFALENTKIDDETIQNLYLILKKVPIIDPKVSSHVFNVLNSLVLHYLNDEEIINLSKFLLSLIIRPDINAFAVNASISLIKSIASRILLDEAFWESFSPILETDNMKIHSIAVEFIMFMSNRGFYYENINLNLIFDKIRDISTATHKVSIFNMFITLTNSHVFIDNFINLGFIFKIEKYTENAGFDLRNSIFSLYARLLHSLTTDSFQFLNLQFFTKMISFVAEANDDELSNKMVVAIHRIITISPQEQYSQIWKSITEGISFDDFQDLFDNDPDKEIEEKMKNIEEWMISNSHE